MTILFYPSVGTSYGIGNYRRCRYLADMLVDRKAAFCLAPDFIEPETSQNGLRVSPDQIQSNGHRFEALVFDHQGPVDAAAMFKEIKAHQPGIVIVALDYFTYGDPNLDAVINLTDFRTDPGAAVTGTDIYRGPEYAIIRDDIQRCRRLKPLSPRVDRVLITFGGEDQSAWTLAAMRWLEDFIAPGLAVSVIVGPLNRAAKQIEAFSRANTRHAYHIRTYTEDIGSLMASTDVAFCGGGTTLAELSFLGIPTAAIPQHDMEARFIEAINRRGFGLAAGRDSLAHGRAEPLARLFADRTLRQTLSQAGPRIVDGDGVQKILKIITAKTDRSKLTRT